MKKSVLILIAFYATILTSSAQVGIGNIPNSNSILDLTNNTKWLILPKSSASPSLNPTFVSTEASLYYFNSKLYFSGFSGVNVLTPWQWDGEAAGVISSLPGNPVGIGLVPTVSNYLLSVAQPAAGDVVASGGSNASIMVGDPAANHLLFDNNEIMAKTGSSTAGVLKLQEEEGIVQIRGAGANTTSTILNVNGSIDASGTGTIKQNGFDLLPRGAIIMWSGSTIPAGWALCDGGLYTPMDGSAPFNTPNLLDRFIVGADLASGTGPAVGSYAIATTGGSISNAHTHDIDPPSSTSTSGGSHTHTGTTAGPSGSSDKCTCAGSSASADSGHTHAFTTDAAGDHTHDTDITNFNSGNASITENRPPYFALAYIMKL